MVRTKTTLAWYLAALALLFVQAGAQAADPAYHALSDIQSTAEAFALEQVRAAHGGDVHAEAARLDPRLRLVTCGEPLQAEPSPGGRLVGRTTIGIRCPGPQPWSLYVPVEVAVHGQVIVAKRPLARGDLVAEDDVEIAERNLAELPYGYLVDVKEVRGMEVRRPVNPGTVLTPAMVEAPRLVERGQRVMLTAETGGIEVRMAGKALSHGASGDRVRVRNLSSERVVEGVVVSAGVVKVSM